MTISFRSLLDHSIISCIIVEGRLLWYNIDSKFIQIHQSLQPVISDANTPSTPNIPTSIPIGNIRIGQTFLSWFFKTYSDIVIRPTDSCTSYHWDTHDDFIKWKHFPCDWPFVRGFHRSPVISLHTGQWRAALMFSLIGAWINGWVNNREAGDLGRHRAHHDVTVMYYILACSGTSRFILRSMAAPWLYDRYCITFCTPSYYISLFYWIWLSELSMTKQCVLVTFWSLPFYSKATDSILRLLTFQLHFQNNFPWS